MARSARGGSRSDHGSSVRVGIRRECPRAAEPISASLIVRIRQAQVHDVDELVALVNAAFAVEQFFVPGPRISRDGIVAQMARGVFLVAESGAKTVGCVFVNRAIPAGYMGLLSVAPDHQGQGIGKRLVEAAERSCREAGCSSIEIRVVNLRSELPPFYRGRGYAERGTEPFDGPTPTIPCHFVLMAKNLDSPEGMVS